MFESRFFRMGTSYQRLQTVSLIYIALPAMLFIAGWLRIYFSIPIIALTIFGIHRSLLAGWHYTPDANSLTELRTKPWWLFTLNHLLLISLAVFVAICTGAGGLAVQDVDYSKHNAFFHDLINF